MTLWCNKDFVLTFVAYRWCDFSSLSVSSPMNVIFSATWPLHLVVSFFFFQMPGSKGFMFRNELQTEAQPLCDKSFTVVRSTTRSRVASVTIFPHNWAPSKNMKLQVVTTFMACCCRQNIIFLTNTKLKLNRFLGDTSQNAYLVTQNPLQVSKCQTPCTY